MFLYFFYTQKKKRVAIYTPNFFEEVTENGYVQLFFREGFKFMQNNLVSHYTLSRLIHEYIRYSQFKTNILYETAR